MYDSAIKPQTIEYESLNLIELVNIKVIDQKKMVT